MSPQLPLAFRFPPDQQFDAFHGQDATRTLVRNVASGFSRDWLYLSGPPASGKTHLLIAACATSRARDENPLYLPLPAVAGRLDQALQGHEGSALVCLDGLEAIAGNHDDEVALFHFHNAARERDMRLVYSALAMPAGLPFVLPDLVSRLEQCTRLALEPISEDGRRAVLRARASRRGLELDDAVLDYLFRRVGRDLGTLTTLLDRLDRESMAAQRRLTVPFLKSVIERET